MGAELEAEVVRGRGEGSQRPLASAMVSSPFPTNRARRCGVTGGEGHRWRQRGTSRGERAKTGKGSVM